MKTSTNTTHPNTISLSNPEHTCNQFPFPPKSANRQKKLRNKSNIVSYTHENIRSNFRSRINAFRLPFPVHNLRVNLADRLANGNRRLSRDQIRQ